MSLLDFFEKWTKIDTIICKTLVILALIFGVLAFCTERYMFSYNENIKIEERKLGTMNGALNYPETLRKKQNYKDIVEWFLLIFFWIPLICCILLILYPMLKLSVLLDLFFWD